MQAPAPPPSQPKTQPSPDAPKPVQDGGAVTSFGIFGGVFGLLSLLLVFLYSYGAAKLSYDKFGSMGWALLDFFFAPVYYPYYAIFLNTPQQPAMGGRRRR